MFMKAIDAGYQIPGISYQYLNLQWAEPHRPTGQFGRVIAGRIPGRFHAGSGSFIWLIMATLTSIKTMARINDGVREPAAPDLSSG
jgi:hypothetical protein